MTAVEAIWFLQKAVDEHGDLELMTHLEAAPDDNGEVSTLYNPTPIESFYVRENHIQIVQKIEL